MAHRQNLPPEPPLLPPVENHSYRPDRMLADRVAAALDEWQVQECLLNVWGQVEQVHDLRDACPGDMAQSGELSVIGHGAVAEQTIEPNRQRHQPRDPRHSAGARRRRSFDLLMRLKHALAVVPAVELECSSNTDSLLWVIVHAPSPPDHEPALGFLTGGK